RDLHEAGDHRLRRDLLRLLAAAGGLGGGVVRQLPAGRLHLADRVLVAADARRERARPVPHIPAGAAAAGSEHQSREPDPESGRRAAESSLTIQHCGSFRPAPQRLRELSRAACPESTMTLSSMTWLIRSVAHPSMALSRRGRPPTRAVIGTGTVTVPVPSL